MIVVIDPYLMSSSAEPLGPSFTGYVAQNAALLGATVIDPIREGWISPVSSGG